MLRTPRKPPLVPIRANIRTNAAHKGIVPTNIEIAPFLRPEHEIQIARAIRSARAESTLRMYASVIRHFSGWTEANGYPGLPARPEIIAAYLTSRASEPGGIAVATIGMAVSALGAWHRDRGFEDPTKNSGVVSVLAGLRRELTIAPEQAPALDLAHWRRILDGIVDDGPAAKRDRALILLGLAGCLRRSELVAIRRNEITLKPGSILLRIPKSKADQEGAGALVSISAGKNDATCPVRATMRWLAVRNPLAADPIFCRLSKSGTVLPGGLDGRAVNLMLARRSLSAGLEHLQVTAHSLRASHATIATSNGARLSDLAHTGRWTSQETVLRYQRVINIESETTSRLLGL